MSLLGAAAISAGASALGSVANNVATGIQNKKARDWQTAENEKARDWELKMYNLENEYNTPANQVARLKAAGLNPNLLYGNGSAVATGGSVGSAQTSAAMPSQGSYDFSGIGNGLTAAINNYQNWQNQDLNRKNVQAVIDNLNSKTAGQQLDNVYKGFQNQFAVENMSTDLLAKKMGISETEAKIMKTNSERQSLEFDLAFKKDTRQLMINELENNILNSKMSRQKMLFEMSQLRSAIAESASRTHLNYIQADYIPKDYQLRSTSHLDNYLIDRERLRLQDRNTKYQSLMDETLYLNDLYGPSHKIFGLPIQRFIRANNRLRYKSK